MDIIPPVPIRSAQLSLHTVDLVLIDASRGASVENSVTRSSQVRSHTIEGISSIRPVDSNITSGIRQMAIEDRGRGQSYQSGGIQPGHLQSIGEIPLMIVIVTDFIEREVDLQKEIEIQAEIGDLPKAP